MTRQLLVLLLAIGPAVAVSFVGDGLRVALPTLADGLRTALILLAGAAWLPAIGLLLFLGLHGWAAVIRARGQAEAAQIAASTGYTLPPAPPRPILMLQPGIDWRQSITQHLGAGAQIDAGW